MKLENQRWVVTGASSGIGRALASALDRQGARVLAVALDEEGLREAFGSGRVRWLAADLGTPEGLDRVFDAALDAWGGLDGFFANAGFASFERSDRADWGRQAALFGVNTLGPIYAFERLRNLQQDRPFTFAATSSAMAYLGMPGYAGYSATKAAVLRYFDTVRVELAPGQRVMTLHPIATRTAFFRQASSSYVPWPTQTAETVARAAVRGLVRGARRVFPFGPFVAVHALFSVLPFLRTLYVRAEWKKTGLGRTA